MAELLRIYHDPPNPKAINQVVRLLKNGGIVIFPSDTVYAMGCAASDKKAKGQEGGKSKSKGKSRKSDEAAEK